MGASSSVDLRHEEVADLMEETLYEPKEIKALYRRFRRLDRRGRGTLRADDLTMIPEVVMNPLAERLLAMFERDKEGSINFRSFARGLSVFNERATAQTKSDILFRVFDVDGDGLISEADLRAVLQLLTGTTLSAAAVDEIVLQTIRDADADQDGVISRADFALFSDLFAWESFTVPVRRAARDQYFLECAGGPALDGGEGPLAPGHG